MALNKNPKYDLKAKYNRVLGICMICSIAILISAFKFFPAMESDFITKKGRKVYTPTVPPPPSKRLEPPLPPPKPPILVEAPDDVLGPDIELEKTDWDENTEVKGPTPPQAEDTEEVEPEWFIAVEQLPEPIGGVAAILAKIEYPPIAKRAGVHGNVSVKAYVDENGIVRKVELLKGIGAGCDEEAMKAVQSTLFRPGKQRGKPVRVQVTVPIKFVLQ